MKLAVITCVVYGLCTFSICNGLMGDLLFIITCNKTCFRFINNKISL